jgi:hypothetical protein
LERPRGAGRDGDTSLREHQLGGAGAEGVTAPRIEKTPDGDQYMLSGFTPVSTHERLLHLAAQPMQSKCPQQPPDFGLFDVAQFNQLDLFQ